MKKLSILFVLSCLCAFLVTNAFAFPVSVGQQIYIDRVGTVGTTSGGEFSVHLYNNGASTPRLFETFCVETDEHITLGPTYPYYIGGISSNAIMGRNPPNGDPISSETAYLYAGFIEGFLTNVYGNNNADADALQNAIWYFEGEGGGTNEYTTEASANHDGSLYGVQVLNLYTTYANGEYSGLAQDLLVVPEPGILILLGIALSAVGLGARRYVF